MHLAQERILALEIGEIFAHRLETQALLAALVPQFVEREYLVPNEPRTADEAPKQGSIGLVLLESETIPPATSHFVIFSHECAIRLAECALYPRPERRGFTAHEVSRLTARTHAPW